ncbi:CPBP family intramembrane glutamic endopeptidase [Silvibacterium dinghuense]|nr:CPBP family intramembrane glutamic endopeptidase [Silvibacterium dinghuense]
MKLRTRQGLMMECLLLFLFIPALLALLPPFIPPMPLLWALALYCLVALRRDPAFHRRELWNRKPFPAALPSICMLFAAGAALIAALVWKNSPTLFFTFTREHPVVWAVVMLLYPVFSVYPQGIVYRAFLMHRYRELAPGRQKETALILLSAVSFAFMHIVFRNWVAMALTFPGGLLFAWRQLRTRSLLTSSVEHALYGCFLFSVGLGSYFYARLI